MFRKLRNKFIILNMTITSLVMLMAFCTVYLTIYNNTKAEIEKKMNSVTSLFFVNSSFFRSGITGSDQPGSTVGGMAFSLNANGGITVSSDADGVMRASRITSDYTPSFIVTVDRDGKVIRTNSLIDMPESYYEEAANTAWHNKNTSDINFAGRSWKYRISPFQAFNIVSGRPVQTEPVEYFQILFLDVTDMQNSLNYLLYSFLFVGIGMSAIILLISIYFANRSIQPIVESWEKQKQFIADASHELKTPITTIMTNCDVLEANENEIIKNQKEWLHYIRIGADRMSRLVNDLLSLARVEGMNSRADKKLFSIAELISDIMQSMNAAAQAKNLFIDQKIEITEDVYSYYEPVRQVITILYENAVKYANEGGNISVRVRRARKNVICVVKNTGKGISPKDLPHIFERFYRSDRARSSDENSYGLGLAIAKSIVLQIGGKITAKSMENEWAEFTFIFEA